ncbi:hypothetical protein CYMTET_54114, partial [Cymbomonas tetramitiformis]
WPSTQSGADHCLGYDNGYYDCFSWDKAAGEGTFHWKWSAYYGNGMVVGPLSSTGFCMDLTLIAIEGITKFNVMTYNKEDNSVSLVEIPVEDVVESGLQLCAKSCTEYCEAQGDTCAACSPDSTPCACLRLGFSAPGLPLAGGTTQNTTSGQFTRAFGAFGTALPGSSGNVVFFLGGSECEGGELPSSFSGGDSGSFVTQREEAAVVGAVLRTGVIYYDRSTVSVQYYASDMAGRPQVSTSGMTVRLTVSDVASSEAVSVTCGTPSTSTGAGSCSYRGTGHLSWFDTAGTKQATAAITVEYSGAVVAQSADMELSLETRVTHDALSSAGMALSMPQSPRFAGDSFTSQVIGHTDGEALSTFGFTVRYAVDVLQYDGITGDAKYLAPTVNDYTAGQVVVLTSGLADGVTSEEVTGSAVTLASITFKVVGASAASYTRALNCTVKEMVSTSSVQLEGSVNAPAQMNDAQGGAATEGVVVVEEAAVVGIYAYASSAEIFNTAYLNGDRVTTTISVQQVYGQDGKADQQASTADVQCAVDGPDGVAAEDGCVVSVGSEHTRGAEGVEVSAAVGVHHTSVVLRVWFPVEVQVTASDPEMSAVRGAFQPEKCGEPLYQRSAVRASATFGGEGLANISGADVTCLVSFAPGNASVLGMTSGNTARGLAPGSTTVSIAGGAAGLVAGVEVRVGETEVEVAQLSAVLVTGAEWGTIPSHVALDPPGELEVVAELKQELTTEGAAGPVYVYAVMSDGNVQQVTMADGANVTAHPDYTTSLEVTVTADGDAEFKAAVPTGGESGESESMLLPTWLDMCTGGSIAAGSGEVGVDLADPISATITTQRSQLARTSDPAAASPISISTSSSLSVIMSYEDGTTKDLTADSRTVYTVTTGSTLVEVKDGSAHSVESGTGFGAATVTVSFPSYAGARDISASVSLEVVGLHSLALFTSPHPAYSGSASTNQTQLGQVQCAGAYQRATCALIATLTDSSTRDVTDAGTFGSSDDSKLVVSGTVVTPTAAGTYEVQGLFEGVSSNYVAMTVVDTPVAITALTHTTGWSSSGTFRDYVNGTKVLAVRAEFEDGTEFSDAVSGQQAAWVPASELLSFASAEPSKIAVDQGGSATLRGNHHEAVRLTATARCGSGAISELPSAADEVKANLRPRANDVDLGNTYGLQFAPAAGGEVLEVPVWLETGSATLNVFDIVLGFSPEHLTATACSVGSEWAAYGFTCTLNDPPDEVLLTGVEISTDVQGLVQLATVSFTVQGGFATTPITATVQGLQTSSSQIDEEYAAVAGQGEVALSSRRRRLAEWGQPGTPVEAELMTTDAEASARSALVARRRGGEAQRRSLQEGSGEVLGDLNADGVFNTFDTQDLKKWATGYPGYTMNEIGGLSDFQRRQLDPTLDFLSAPDSTSNCPTGWTAGTPCPSPLDAQYLQYVYANFLRFVKLETQADVSAMVTEPESAEGTLAVTVAVYDKLGVPVSSNTTRVRYELGTALNQGMQVTLGDDTTLTQDGVLVTAAGPDSATGAFTMSARGGDAGNGTGGFVGETEVGVVVILETFDTLYATLEERVFAFCGSAVVGSSFSSFTSFDFPESLTPSPPLPSLPPLPSPLPPSLPLPPPPSSPLP